MANNHQNPTLEEVHRTLGKIHGELTAVRHCLNFAVREIAETPNNEIHGMAHCAVERLNQMVAALEDLEDATSNFNPNKSVEEARRFRAEYLKQPEEEAQQ